MITKIYISHCTCKLELGCWLIDFKHMLYLLYVCCSRWGLKKFSLINLKILGYSINIFTSEPLYILLPIILLTIYQQSNINTSMLRLDKIQLHWLFIPHLIWNIEESRGELRTSKENNAYYIGYSISAYCDTCLGIGKFGKWPEQWYNEIKGNIGFRYKVRRRVAMLCYELIYFANLRTLHKDDESFV
jgi:hypothetical protein